MFARMWIGPMIAALAVVLSLPCAAEVSASGYDRMDGDYIRPNRRPTPKRNFNTTLSESDRLNIYSVKRSGKSRAGMSTGSGRTVKSESSQILDQQNDAYGPEVNRILPSGDSRRANDAGSAVVEAGDAGANENAASPADIETTEAEDVPAASPPQPRALSDAELAGAMVFCSKNLLEYHWDRNCAMLKNVKPTPLTLLSAKNSNYVECSECKVYRPQR